MKPQHNKRGANASQKWNQFLPKNVILVIRLTSYLLNLKGKIYFLRKRQTSFVLLLVWSIQTHECSHTSNCVSKTCKQYTKAYFLSVDPNISH